MRERCTRIRVLLGAFATSVVGVVALPLAGWAPLPAAAAVDTPLEISAPSVAFGPVNVGQTVTTAVTVTNTSADPFGPINIFGGAVAAPFSAGQNCQSVTLAAGASCEITYQFSPTAPGPAAGASSFTISATAVQAAGESFEIALRGCGGVAECLNATFGNDGPVVEGGTASVGFTGVVDPSGTSWTYSYDFDADGTFDVVDSASPSAVVPAGLTDDGPAAWVVEGRITNDLGHTVDLTTTIQVTNAAPSVTVTGPGSAGVGEVVTFDVVATDPSPTDQGADFVYSVDFGDGTADAPALPSVAALDHTYAAAGTYTVTVVATDKDGAAGEPATHEITIAVPTPPTRPDGPPSPTTVPSPITTPPPAPPTAPPGSTPTTPAIGPGGPSVPGGPAGTSPLGGSPTGVRPGQDTANGPALVRTGSASGDLVPIGLVSFVAGGVLILLARRRAAFARS